MSESANNGVRAEKSVLGQQEARCLQVLSPSPLIAQYETARLHKLAAFSVILLNGSGGGHCPQVPTHILPGEKKRRGFFEIADASCISQG